MWRMTECDRSVWAETATREPCALKPVWLDGERSKFRCDGAARPGVPQLASAGFAGPTFRFYCSWVFSARPGPVLYATKSDDAVSTRYVDAEVCQDCHEEQYQSFTLSVHKRVFDRDELADRGCEGCHGAGAEHVDGGGDPARIRSFGGHPRTLFRKPAPAATKRSSVTRMPRSV